MKRRTTTIIFILIFLAGLSLLLYPSVSNYWNSFHSTQAVVSYQEAVGEMSEEDCEKMLREAEEYNRVLGDGEQYYHLSDEKKKEYYSLLDLNGDGMMGYIEIPAIDVELPIYHGTDDRVLQNSAGHLEWTSLPTGGESTHTVISGHRGLPGAKLFTDLDRLSKGDIFTVTVLDRTLTYEVDEIQTVEPGDTEDLKIQKGMDLCTLVTCTPYGINTHRLLVRGHRVENASEFHITSEAEQLEPLMVMPFVALPLLVIAFILLRRVEKRFKWDEMIDKEDGEEERNDN